MEKMSTENFDVLNHNQKAKRKAYLAFILSVTCLIISLIVIVFKINRHYAGILNWYLFIPLSLLALYNSITFIFLFIRHRKGISVIYLLLALPPLTYYIYFILKINLQD